MQTFNREWRGPGKPKIKNAHHSFLSFCSRTGLRRTGFQKGLSLGPCLALLLLSAERLQKLVSGSCVTLRKLWVPASRAVPGNRWVPVFWTFMGDNWVAACWIALGDRWVLHISFFLLEVPIITLLALLLAFQSLLFIQLS